MSGFNLGLVDGQDLLRRSTMRSVGVGPRGAYTPTIILRTTSNAKLKPAVLSVMSAAPPKPQSCLVYFAVGVTTEYKRYAELRLWEWCIAGDRKTANGGNAGTDKSRPFLILARFGIFFSSSLCQGFFSVQFYTKLKCSSKQMCSVLLSKMWIELANGQSLKQCNFFWF